MPRVLIVEDDDVVADGMVRHLEAGGFDAASVERGELPFHSRGRGENG